MEKSRLIQSRDIDRVYREIAILKRINHPNIVGLHEMVETPQAIYLIMEYAAGGELFTYIVERRKLSEPEAARFYWQILNGLEYLHKLKIAHRDLKPENILLDKHMQTLKIVDFGLSNTYETCGTLKTACGSPCYAAPEMVAGKSYDPLAADLWSSGVTLYAMVCGYLPFEHTDAGLLYRRILKGEFEIPSFLSIEAVQILKGLLTVDPAKRLTIEQVKRLPWLMQHSQTTSASVYSKMPPKPTNQLNRGSCLSLEEKVQNKFN